MINTEIHKWIFKDHQVGQLTNLHQALGHDGLPEGQAKQLLRDEDLRGNWIKNKLLI